MKKQSSSRSQRGSRDGKKSTALLESEEGMVKLGRKDLLPDQSKDDELLQEEKENGSNERETETNHADETDMTVHEAREEHYKADDASSAVSHESRILNTERLKESFGNSTGPAQENGSNATIIEVEVQKEPVLKLGEAVEKTTTEVKEGDSESSNSESAVPEASGFVQNETKTMQERSQEHDRTEDGAPPSGSSDLQTLVQLEQTGNETDANVTELNFSVFSN
ncbi:Uncharacterized protein Rs2_08849 [Raphanus sativus]|nr:Uncharacterized protein Rs2_08839 [Raphanus sativus]KAJ4914228.1 Uncharacterized protein Rs2_08849 [Raphanus sativus]